MRVSRHFRETTIAGRWFLDSSDNAPRSSSGDSAASIAFRSDSWNESKEMIRVCRRTGIESGRGETSESSSGGGREMPRSDDSD